MAREILAEGRHLRLVRDDGWEYAQRTHVSGIVVIAALTPERRVIFVEQYRKPVGCRVIEMPAGLAGDIPGSEDEPLSAAAHRELEEETGYVAATMERVTAGPVSAGMTTEVLTFFRATGLRRVSQGGGDASEDIEVHEVPIDEAEAWIAGKAAEGVMADPKVFAGLYFLR